MKAFLLYPQQDFDLEHPHPANAETLTQDLELNVLFNAMARKDSFLFKAAQTAILTGLTNDLDTIRYRQAILEDCLKNPALIRDLYVVIVTALENKRKHWLGLYSRSPSGILSGSIQLLEMFVELLKKLKHLTDEHAHRFASEGFRRFFAMIQTELDDAYFAVLQTHLKELKFPNGVLISAALGKGNEPIDYLLRKPHENQGWLKQIFSARPPSYSFTLHPRDDNGFRALSDIQAQALNNVANAVAQSADHIHSFFEMLRVELAFYIGCLNLYEQLDQMGSPVTFPEPVPSDERKHAFTGLYDICLALTMQQKVVGNEVNADAKDLVIITGANQGGKSTFLRSIGLAQLMMQSGMFVPAEGFCANLCNGLFTHYKRQEDATMESGKLDEELSRMSDIVTQLRPHALVLFNESFAATNEREGSEIGRQITTALLERRIKVFFVTHQYEFARGFYERALDNAHFLRAERQPDGSRTFKLVEARPLATSYGEDLYAEIFGPGATHLRPSFEPVSPGISA